MAQSINSLCARTCSVVPLPRWQAACDFRILGGPRFCLVERWLILTLGCLIKRWGVDFLGGLFVWLILNGEKKSMDKGEGYVSIFCCVVDYICDLMKDDERGILNIFSLEFIWTCPTLCCCSGVLLFSGLLQR